MGSAHDLRELRDAAAALGETLAEASWSKIRNILEVLEKYSKSLNLTGAKDWAELESHAIEALVAISAARRAGLGGTSWLDVGTGGGLPGLVVGCVWPGVVTLVEPRARRAAFLELGAAVCGPNVVVRRARLEGGRSREFDGASALPHNYGVASARAVFSPEDWLRIGPNWVRDDGVCLVHVRAGEAPVDPGRLVAAVTWGRWQVQAYVSRETE